jgi:hypothetical protein
VEYVKKRGKDWQEIEKERLWEKVGNYHITIYIS